MTFTSTKFNDLRTNSIVTLALNTGCRRGEILFINWSDLEEESKTLNVERTLDYDKDGYRFTPPKSESSIRKIKIRDIHK